MWAHFLLISEDYLTHEQGTKVTKSIHLEKTLKKSVLAFSSCALLSPSLYEVLLKLSTYACMANHVSSALLCAFRCASESQ